MIVKDVTEHSHFTTYNVFLKNCLVFSRKCLSLFYYSLEINNKNANRISHILTHLEPLKLASGLSMNM